MLNLMLHTKNFAHMQDIQIESDYVPRVGEVIDLSSELPGMEVQKFFIYEILWAPFEGKLIPNLSCRQWWEGDRRVELEERGWL